jgi:hypothetical protein
MSRPSATNPYSPSFDSSHNISALSTGRCQLIEVKPLHEMKQGDAVSLAQLAFPLPETWNKFPITCHTFRLVDAVGFPGRFEQVPKLVGQESAITIVG